MCVVVMNIECCGEMLILYVVGMNEGVISFYWKLGFCMWWVIIFLVFMVLIF